jgi:predicted kinase
MSKRIYHRLIELGLPSAAQGETVILDAQYPGHEQREQLIQTAQSRGLRICFVYCTAPPEIFRARIRSRSGDIADATVSLVDSQQRELEPFGELELRKMIALDTRRPLNELLAEIERAVEVE